jgi:hypothetical protein
VYILGAHRARGMSAHRFEHVLDRHVTSAESARRDRAVVEHEARKVETGEGHHRRGNGLVAADEADEPVEEVATRDELDRVRDHLAGDERGAHPFAAHRDAVRDSDRVELDRRAAGRSDAALDIDGKLALVEIARHRLDPRCRDTDERAGKVVIVEAGSFQHRACSGAVDTVGERCAVALRRV